MIYGSAQKRPNVLLRCRHQRWHDERTFFRLCLADYLFAFTSHFERKIELLLLSTHTKAPSSLRRLPSPSPMCTLARKVMWFFCCWHFYFPVLDFLRTRQLPVGKGFPGVCEEENVVPRENLGFDGERWKRNAIICLVGSQSRMDQEHRIRYETKKTSVTFRDPLSVAIRCLVTLDKKDQTGGHTCLNKEDVEECVKCITFRFVCSGGCTRKWCVAITLSSDWMLQLGCISNCIAWRMHSWCKEVILCRNLVVFHDGDCYYFVNLSMIERL